MDIDPVTGLPVFDPSTAPSTTGLTINTNPFRGVGAVPATPMRGSRPNLSALLPNVNPISQAQGPGAPTSLPMQRPSGQPGNGPPLLGDVDSPGGGFGGGAPSGPLQYGPGRGPPGPAPYQQTGWPGAGSGVPDSFHIPNYGPVHPDGSASGPTAQDGGGSWLPDWLRNLGSSPAVGPNGALPMGSGMSPAMAPAGDTTRGPGSDASSPLTGAPGGGGGPGGIGSDANFPMAGGPLGQQPAGGMGPNLPPGGLPRAAGGGRVNPAHVNLGRGVPGIPAAAAPAPRWGDAPQTNSPFTMILRPNAPANSGGGRGGGGPALTTALDLSGYRAPPPVAAPVRRAAAPRAAPVRRARVPGPLAKPAPYPVTESGSPTPLSAQHGGVGFPTTPAGYGDQSWLYGNQPPM